MRHAAAITSGLALAAATWALASPARAEPLTDKEYDALVAGEVVGRPVDVDIRGVSYFGVVSYAVIDSSADDVLAALTNPAAYAEILPRVLEATPTDKRGDLRYVRLTQGGKLGAATYTVVIKKESPRLVRFWLDPAQHHDIADCWGFYELEAIDPKRTLVHWGALLHLDFGVTKLLFTEMIRGYAMTAPAHLRMYLQAREAATAPPPATPGP
ncbi:MAG TPA: SRPBCC family protein [Byssovorax sp.]